MGNNRNKIVCKRCGGKLIKRKDDEDIILKKRLSIYDKEGVEKLAKWFDLRKKHLNHLRKLKPIKDECQRFISTRPLDPHKPPKGHNLKDMKRAFDKMKQWQRDLDKLRKENIEFREDYYRKLKK